MMPECAQSKATGGAWRPPARLLLSLLLVFVAIVWFAPESWADASSTPAAAVASGTVNTNCDGYLGVTNRIAGCIRDTIGQSAGLFFSKVYPFLRYAIGAVMTLAVVVYGVMLSMGLVERVSRDSVILLFKLSVVIGLTANSSWLYLSAVNMMDSAAAAVVSYVPSSGTVSSSTSTDFSQSICIKTVIQGQAATPTNKPVSGPWLGVDCLYDSVIGIRTLRSENMQAMVNDTRTYYNNAIDGKNGTAEGPMRGLLFLFFSGFSTSIMGLVFAVIGFLFLYSFVMMTIKALFTYLAGYIGVALLMILSPLMIPLILFQHTKQYFDKWAKLVLSCMIQPSIMLVFLVFSLTAIDFAVFSGKYSLVYRIAGEASRQPGFNLNEYLSAIRDANGNVATTGTSISRQQPKTVAQVLADRPVDPVTLGKTRNGFLNTNCDPKSLAEDRKANPPAAGETQTAMEKVCGWSFPIKLDAQFLDWNLMAKARELQGPPVAIDPAKASPTVSTTNIDDKGQQIAREVLAACVFCAVILFLLNGLMALVPIMAYDILGDFGQSPSLGGAVANFDRGKKVMSDFAAPFKKMMG